LFNNQYEFTVSQAEAEEAIKRSMVRNEVPSIIEEDPNNQYNEDSTLNQVSVLQEDTNTMDKEH
jgi:hypothetical protein